MGTSRFKTGRVASWVCTHINDKNVQWVQRYQATHIFPMLTRSCLLNKPENTDGCKNGWSC